MKILITGGAGFIGSHLCDALLAKGHCVIALDNLCTGSLANVEHLQGRADFTFVEADVVAPLDVACDAIFHLASPASPRGYLSRPIETGLANTAGTYNLLRNAQRHGARFLMASTSEVYGDPLEHPQRETYWGNVNPNGPRACYDESKRMGEVFTLDFLRVHGVDARIVRIFNTYGPRSQPGDGRVVPSFIVQALRGDPLTVFGDGSQTRSFCYVDDLVEGLQAAMFSPGTRGEVFNLGNPDELSILDLARRIALLVGSRSTVRTCPLPQDDPVRRKPDIGKAQRVLGWQPRVPLNEGLRATIDWFRRMALAA